MTYRLQVRQSIAPVAAGALLHHCRKKPAMELPEAGNLPAFNVITSKLMILFKYTFLII